MAHALLYLALAVTILGTAFLPTLPRCRWLGQPVWYVLLGYAMFRWVPGLTPIVPEYDADQSFGIEIATELIVIISLAVAGLAIDTRPGWKRWSPAGRLLLVTMPLCIAGVALLGWWWGGLVPAAACLLGAVVSPTDPVLAQAVQVGPPGEGDAGKVRFALTAEAGLNDGLAFPFVYLALALASQGSDWGTLGMWAAVDVGWRVVVGTAVGAGVGYVLAHVVFRHTDEPDRKVANEGVLVMASIFLAYGLAELVQGYGFLAVFSAAIAARRIDPEHRYHLRTHQFATHLEDVLLAIMLIGFGGLLASGVLHALTWVDAGLAVVFLVGVRPLAGVLALLGYDMPWRDRLAVSWLGIRGVGSVYYLAYALNKHPFEQADRLWAITGLVILLSLVLHATTAEPVLRALCKQGDEKPEVGVAAPEALSLEAETAGG